MKKILSIIAVIFIGIQFIPVNKTNPPVIHEITWDSQETYALAKRACLDCHSNETKWPWYSSVAPFSWLVVNHVNDGRKHFNVSSGILKHAHEAADELQNGEMPLKSYVMLHPEADLNETEKEKLAAGLKKTFESYRKVENRSN